MKIIISLLLCLVFNISSFAQNNLPNNLLRDKYLHKSKVNKQTAHILLGIGAALFVTGGIIDHVKKPELLAGFDYEFFGVTSALISIPFFISASNNKKKAMTISINNQKNLWFHNVAYIQPSISFKISFYRDVYDRQFTIKKKFKKTKEAKKN